MPKKLHSRVLPLHSFKLLKWLSNAPQLANFYLVGGTALSLTLGHRKSIDLDFFSNLEFPSNIVNFLPKSFETISIHNNSIEIILDDTKVFFFYFAFPRRYELVVADSIKMADPVDIGLMKLLALQGRSTKKDIIDLFFLDKKVIPLEELVDIFNNFYPKEKLNSYESIKTILTPNALENQPDPVVLDKILYKSWDNCFNYVASKLMSIVKRELETTDL